MNVHIKYACIIGCIAIGLLIYFRALGYIIMYMNFQRKIKMKSYHKDYHFVEENHMQLLNGSFLSNGNRLKSYFITKNTGNSKQVVVLSKGHGCFITDYKEIITELVGDGYDVFSFDITGSGESEGAYPGGYQQWVIDLQAALKVVKKQYDDIYILGHSIGGYAAATVLKDCDVPIKAVVAVAPINSGTEYATYMHKCIPCIFTKQVWIAMHKYELKHYKEYVDYTGVAGVNATDIPILIVQGKKDRWVPVKCSIAGYSKQIINSNANILFIEKGKHYLLNDENVRSNIRKYIKNI